MNPMASQITSLTIVYSIVYSGTDGKRHQSSASLVFVWGTHRCSVPSLVQMRADCVFAAKPLSEPMISIKHLQTNFKGHFDSRKCNRKCCLQYGGHFPLALTCYLIHMRVRLIAWMVQQIQRDIYCSFVNRFVGHDYLASLKSGLWLLAIMEFPSGPNWKALCVDRPSTAKVLTTHDNGVPISTRKDFYYTGHLSVETKEDQNIHLKVYGF